MFDLSKLVICWVVMLCLAIWRPLRNLWLHVDNKCGHVSLSLLLHRVQLGLGNLWG